MYKISIRVPFRAGHRLVEPYEGKCNNVHGEGYTAIVEFESQRLDDKGMVFDFGKVKKQVKDWIDVNWDHSYIHHKSDVVGKILKDAGLRTFELEVNPTAENMALYLYEAIKENVSDLVSKVGIIESFEDSIAWYEVY